MPTAPRTQQNRQFAIATPLGENNLLFHRMEYRESLGRPFEMDIEVLSEDTAIDPNALLGENVTVRCELPNLEGKTRYFNGVVSTVGQGALESGLASYRLRVVPWLWFLTKSSDCRIFQEMTAVDIIKQVFRDLGFTDFRESLSATYRTWEYCVQYRETAFAFVSRIMEQEGIYSYFEHEDGKHTLVLIDDAASHEPFPDYERIDFRPFDKILRDSELIHEFAFERTVQPGAFAQTDFDFTAPTKELLTKSAANREHDLAEFELFDFPGEYAEAGEGDRYTAVRLDEHQCRHAIASGRGDTRGIAVGRLFELADHPIESQNAEYLVTEATISAESDPFGTVGEGRGSEGDAMTVSFTCIPSEQQFRPARVTPLPFVRGPQTALVVGPSGEEIHTDEHGRVKVMFHWDRESVADETSSCWIRVSQEFAGKAWGSMQIPRVGHEVIVSFLEGDPDRPLITGRVYNGDNKPPYAPKTFGTMTTWKTNSSKGGGGFNELRFEDKKDEEQIFLHAQKNMDIRVLGDRFETVVGSRHLIIETDRFEHVKNERHLQVDADNFETFKKDRHLDVGGQQATKITDAYSLDVGGDSSLSTGGDHKIEVTGELHIKASKIVLEGSQGISLKSGGSEGVWDSSGVSLKGSQVVADGQQVKLASGPGSAAVAAQGGSLVAPTAATAAEEADDADPGEVAEVKAKQKESKTGKYGAAKTKPYTPPTEEETEAEERTWIEIEMIDEEDEPVPGQRYQIEVSDGRVIRGTLDNKGFARVEGLEPGNCKVTFPTLDKEAWEPA
jgi:type VI secretion system secreted protein VgrG